MNDPGPQRRHRRAAVLCASLALLALTGCVSKSAAKTHAHRAYLAGRQQALAQMQQQNPTGAPTVSFTGAVKNSLLVWSPDLTLSQAIVEAGYESVTAPKLIVIQRNGSEFAIDPQRLLDGEDFPLQAGDQIELRD